MCFEEPRVLPDNVHDVGCTNRLIVLPSFHFCQTKEVFNDSNQKALFCFLVWKRQPLFRSLRRSCSLIAPEIEPMAQHKVFRLFQDHSEPSIWSVSRGREV